MEWSAFDDRNLEVFIIFRIPFNFSNVTWQEINSLYKFIQTMMFFESR